MKVLVINGHPTPKESAAGKAILNAFLKQRPDAIVRTLAERKADSPTGFDVKAEQAALRDADIIVWHFPFYWYSVPGLMKTWIDSVFLRGFAHGSNGTALRGKKLVISLTTGAPEAAYAEGMPMNWPLEAFMPPLRQTASLCGMEMLDPVATYGTTAMVLGGDEGREALAQATQKHAERLAAVIASIEKAEA